MANYDGKVVISTELDNSGVNKGIKQISGQFGGLKSVVKSLGATIASVFALRQIVAFANESSKAAMQLSDALTGLQSILDGQGRSFSKAQSFIEDYTRDGLIPATDAITAYRNLASRGYDDTQIQQVMTALKDASAYGRQASMTMGEAVQSATEGLKNENSILVDNAGVTKNVAKMWDEYAASIGTTANNLTQQQKIQAEVNGIMEETKFQTGDAAKVAGTLSGQLQQLSFNFNNLKVAVGNAVNPIVQNFLPVINTAIQTLTQFANAVASVVGALFGKASVQASTLADTNESIATTASSGAAAEEELANATEAAGKAAKKSLASFDEINKLQDSTGGGSGSASGASGGSSSSANSITTADTEVEDTISPQLQAVIDNIQGFIEDVKAFGEQIRTALQPTVSAWGDAFSSLSPAVESARDRISAAWTNLKEKSLAPFGKYITTNFVPSIVNTFSKNFAPIFADVMPVAMDVWTTDFENACALVSELCTGLEVAFEGVKTVFSDMCESISSNWDKYGSTLLQGFTDFKDGLWDIWWYIYDNIISPVMGAVGDTMSWLWDKHLKPLWDDIVEFVMSVSENILALWNGFLKPIVDFLVALFAPAITNVIGLIVDAVSVAAAFISDMIGAILKFLDGLIQYAVGVFTHDWERAWGGVSKMFDGVWKGLSAVVKGAANTIIWVINSLISAIYSGISGIVNGLGSVVSNVGNMLGKKWGFSVPTRAPKIPYLAQGAVLPANKPFLAVVGDQKNGTNIEAPLSTIEEALANVLKQWGDTIEVKTDINFSGDLAQLARVLKPAIDSEAKRRGSSLATEVFG